MNVNVSGHAVLVMTCSKVRVSDVSGVGRCDVGGELPGDLTNSAICFISSFHVSLRLPRSISD